MDKILVAHGEGIGNCIQIAPLLKTLSKFYEVDYWHAFSSYTIPHNLLPYVGRCFIGAEIGSADLTTYSGSVSTYWTRDYVNQLGIPLLCDIHPLSMVVSEVETYMMIAADLGIAEEDFEWYGECNYNETDYGFDIIVNNGYNCGRPAKWEIKGYPYYRELLDILINKGYNIGSTGSKHEYIRGTGDMTGMDLLDTGGVIKNSTLLISTDSGMYHYANALHTPNIVLFTATSVEKNYDERFHKYSIVMGRDDLDCRPCQGGKMWMNGCTSWECQKIDPEVIAQEVEVILG